jgi:deoxycytidine triphosphate deaminase
MSAEEHGGVLSDAAIRSEVREGRLIVGEGFDESQLEPASYNVTVANDGLITPGGEEVRPDSGKVYMKKIVLDSGDTAVFSTRERFRMPASVAGNITIKNRFAKKGVMLLSGLLIDPGYGEGNVEGRPGCRLYLHVGNISSERITITPGEEQIARIQFLRVSAGDLPKKTIDASLWKDQRQPSLSFLTELKQLKDMVEHTRRLANTVLLLGLFVLAVTVLGVSLSTIFSITANTELVRNIHTAVPHTPSGKVLASALAVSIALLVLAASLFFRLRKIGRRRA